MRLRRILLNQDIPYCFNVFATTSSYIFKTWVRIIARKLVRSVINWIPIEAVEEHMPEGFKIKGYNLLRVILDCTGVILDCICTDCYVVRLQTSQHF